MVLNNMKMILKYLSLIGQTASLTSKSVVVSFVGEDAIVSASGETMSGISAITSSSATWENANPIQSISTTQVTSYGVSTSPGSTKLGFGTGRTPVAETDYCLEELITTPIKMTVSYSPSFTISDDGKTCVRKTTATVLATNSAENSITIGEVGFFEHICYNNTANKMVMLHRIVLDEAVTIEAGASATFTFEFEFTNSIA